MSATGGTIDTGSSLDASSLVFNPVIIDISLPKVHTWPTCDKAAKEQHLWEYRKYLFDLDKLSYTPEIEYRIKICRELIKDIG